MLSNNKHKLRFTLLAVIIILVSFFLRIYSPLSDIPADISISGSIYTDEGNQCHNSRSKVLYDDWFPDNWKITNYNPLVPYFKLLIFKIFGVGLVQVRSVSFFFSLISLIFFFLTLRSYFNSWFAIAGITLLGFNFLFIMYNRIGTFETPMIFWMILSLYFLEKYRVTGKYLFSALSGIAAFLSFVFKMTGAHIILVSILSLFLLLIITPASKKKERKKLIYSLLIIFSVVVTALLFWLIVFYFPNKEWIESAPGSYIGNQMFPKTINQLIGNILSYNWKEQFYRMWVVWVVAILYLPIFYRRVANKVADLTEIGFVFFLLSHTGALMIMNHRPTRYLIAAIPPMVFLTVLFLKHFAKERGVSTPLGLGKGVILFFLDTIWLFLSLYYCFLPLIERIGLKIIPNRLNLRLLFISIILVSMTQASIKLSHRYINPKGDRKYFRITIIIILISISFHTNISYYLTWKRDRTRYVNKISVELGKKIKNGYIAGLTAPVAVLGTNHRSLFLYPKFVHWHKDTLEKYGITHALLANFNFEITNFFNQWSQKMRNSKLLNAYNVKDQFLHLYSFTDPVITGIMRLDQKTIELQILNNGKELSVLLGKLEFSKNIGSSSEKYTKVLFPVSVIIKKGKNSIIIHDNYNGREKLIYIHDGKWGNSYRYEAEKFPKKRGRVIRDASASGKHVRFFNVKKDQIGYMACSIGGKFIPYTEGFMDVAFFLRFDNIKSKIRPLAVIDIFSNTKRESVSSFEIKKRDVKGREFCGYRVEYKLKGVNDIEFRVYAKKTSDVYYDYLILNYFQGKFVY